MILSAQSIRKAAEAGMIIPFNERTIYMGLSYGLGPAGYDIRIAENLILPSKSFSLASSVEYLNIPSYLQGILHDKSTWARRGLSVYNTVFDPGFRGYATLELVNHSKIDIEFQRGVAIAQMVFEMLDESTETPYEGKYQDQQAGPQEAR